MPKSNDETLVKRKNKLKMFPRRPVKEMSDYQALCMWSKARTSWNSHSTCRVPAGVGNNWGIPSKPACFCQPVQSQNGPGRMRRCLPTPVDIEVCRSTKLLRKSTMNFLLIAAAASCCGREAEFSSRAVAHIYHPAHTPEIQLQLTFIRHPTACFLFIK